MQRRSFRVVTSAMSRNFSLRFLDPSLFPLVCFEDGENASGGPSSPRSARGAVLQRERSGRRILEEMQPNRGRVCGWTIMRGESPHTVSDIVNEVPLQRGLFP